MKFFIFLFLFLVSCSSPSSDPNNVLDYSLQNKTSEIITVMDSNDKPIKILKSFCFKFSSNQFPLTILFSSGSTKTLNEPTHYVIEGQKGIKKTSTPCTPLELE